MSRPAPAGFKIGTENKKQVYILGGLVAVAVVIFAVNTFSGSDPAPVSTPARNTSSDVPGITPGVSPGITPDAPTVRRRGGSRADLRPVPWRLGPAKAGARDTSRIDPTLRLDLLARLQTVDATAAGRNLFQLGAAPAPATALKVPAKIHPTPGAVTAADAVKPGPPPEPTAPPIDLKYYGYSTVKGDSRRKVFFLDGEDIIMAFEGDLVKRRYKVVKVNATSVTLEDTQFKSTQTLPLQPESNG